MSYNILADKYARHYRSYLYDSVPSTYLDWSHRRAAILAELAHLQPDILCLQEVDRYEELEAELEKLGYAGIYLQRDGGRRDGCATFWRTSLLQPALVRQLRYSQYDLKDNVALLVLFEPHRTHRTAAAAAASAQAGPLLQQQVQPQLSSPQLQQQERQEQQSQQQHTQDLLSQWLPRSWRTNSSGGAGGQQHHPQHSKVRLRPAPQLFADSGSGSSGLHPLYQLPAGEQVQHGRSWAGSGLNSISSSPGSSSSSSPAYDERRRSKSSGKGGRVGGLGSRSRSGRSAQVAQASAAAAESSSDGLSGAGLAAADEQVQLAPDWHRCGLLVANTHIIFTPDKGEVKLGQVCVCVAATFSKGPACVHFEAFMRMHACKQRCLLLVGR
ncbi:hypothetical protein COO60DRAFT_946990 [Scenedesmus sp. NREL 46B-D3]|nr:hypothetical protein COO60DRAFT_946990 [Scenedesmus sp. NREL 46B-D3]